MKTTTPTILALLAICAPAAAQEAPRVEVPLVKGELVLDGVEVEDAWSSATRLEGFTVYEPNTEVAPRFEASARVLRTDKALYFFIEVDNRGAEVLASMSARDNTPDGDRIEIQLDPQGRGRRGYSFTVGAAGVLRDATINEGGGQDSAWDALFDAATEVGEGRWTAEVRIPFQSLRFDPSVESWGVHLFATSWKHQQSLSWAPIDRDVSNRLTLAGTLEGMGGLKPGRAVELLPSLTAAWAEDGELGAPPCDFGADPGSFEVCGAALSYGLGVKWGVTPSLTVDAVFNPDFSQVEADPGQLTVNNRFALFLAERRPFFIEGRDIFEGPIDVIYTRSINQPSFALKLTGGQRGFRIGALVAEDNAPPDSVIDGRLSPSSVAGKVTARTTILRGQQDLGEAATVGFFAIDRAWQSTSDETLATNRVFGIDGQGSMTRTLRGEGALFMSQADTFDGALESGWAGRGKLTWQTDQLRVQTLYERVHEGFRSESGFIPRVDYHEIFAKIDGYHRGEQDWGRFISPGLYGTWFLDDSGEVVERTLGGNTFWEFGGRVSLFAVYDRRAESLDEVWFESNDFYLSLGVSTLKWARLSTSVGFGDTIIRDPDLLGDRAPFLGWQRSPSVTLTLRPISSVTWLLSLQERAIFDARGGEELVAQPIARSTLQVFLTRDLDLRYIAQWRDLERALRNDLLLSFKPSPGTVFFLGYREDTDLSGAASLSQRSVFAKLSILYSL